MMSTNITPVGARVPTPLMMLQACVDHAMSLGIRIVPGGHALQIVNGVYTARIGAEICPISALLLGIKTSRETVTLQALFDDGSRALNVSKAWVNVFLDGFDDTEDACGLHDDAWELGQQFARRSTR